MDEKLRKDFNDFLTSLPSDKREMILDKLKSAKPEERIELVRKLVEKNNQSAAARTAQKAPAANDAFSPAESHKVSGPVHTDRKSTSQNSPHKGGKKKLKKGFRTGLIAASSAVVILAVVFAGIKAGWFEKLFAGNDGEAKDTKSTSAVETSLTETTPETTETTPEATPTPTPTPEPTHYPLDENAPDLTGMTIVLDPGHQKETDKTPESVASWLSAEKARCTSGSTGVVTGKGEYEVTLEEALITRDILEQCGATVYLTRDTNDVNMSNQERAMFALECNPDIFIRIHADAANDSATSGVKVYVPDSGDYSSRNVAWADEFGKTVAEAEGLEFAGTKQTYMYTGLNYANSVPAFQISLGYMSNSDDEALITDEEVQVRSANAIAVFCDYMKNNK
ncbi:MAG: N-acetylmuramoyl-L-alanine amidase [Clostridiales bacterium]|nr:N-acetylmuramoyl-L-alanine amidase [Clostridiales bacterium]